MKAFGKVLGLFFLGLLLLVVALGFALTHLFDPNDYKDEIRQIARDKANLELDLKGDIGWSLFPWLGLELHDTSIASTATPTKPFADLQMLGLSVRVLPLLRKDVQMSAIRVEGLSLDLVRDKQGKGNWENIGKPAQPQAPSAPSATPPAADGKGAQAQAPEQAPQNDSPRTPIKLDIDSLNVNNARVTYTDEASGKQYNVEGIELSTGAIREGSSIPLKLNAYLGTNQPVVRVKTELTGNLRFDTALRRYQLEDARLSGEASGEPLQGKTATFSAQGQLLLDQSAQIAEWNGLKLSVNQLRALGELKARELDKDAKFSGGLSIAPMNLREFLAGIGVTLPAMADANTLGKFELNTRLAGSRNSLNLETSSWAWTTPPSAAASASPISPGNRCAPSSRATSSTSTATCRPRPSRPRMPPAPRARRKSTPPWPVPPRATRRYRKNRPGRPGATRRCCPWRPCASSTWTWR